MALTISDYTVQASATNTAGSTATATGVDLSAAYRKHLTGKITNGATGPTIPCDFIVDISNDAGSTWSQYRRYTAGVANSGIYAWTVQLPDSLRYVRTRFVGNTAQSVTVEAIGGKITAL